jgi:hypothetical protein
MMIGLLVIHIISRFELGGYLLWNDVQTLSAIALLTGTVWLGWKSREVAVRFALVVCFVVLAVVQWGIPKLMNFACSETVVASLESAGARLVSTKSDCGATTAEAYKVVLIDGVGLFRRRRVVIESYLSPIPSIVALDSNLVKVDLLFIPRDSLEHLEIPLLDLGGPRRFYRGKPQGD